jgi:hypothetical protein
VRRQETSARTVDVASTVGILDEDAALEEIVDIAKRSAL